VLEPPDCYYNI